MEKSIRGRQHIMAMYEGSMLTHPDLCVIVKSSRVVRELPTVIGAPLSGDAASSSSATSSSASSSSSCSGSSRSGSSSSSANGVTHPDTHIHETVALVSIDALSQNDLITF